MSSRIRFGFKGKDQKPLFIIWREYLENGDIVFGKVLFNSYWWIGI